MINNATKTNIIRFKIHRRKKGGESDTHVLLSIILIHEFSQKSKQSVLFMCMHVGTACTVTHIDTASHTISSCSCLCLGSQDSLIEITNKNVAVSIAAVRRHSTEQKHNGKFNT
jgi:hypothetical protein